MSYKIPLPHISPLIQHFHQCDHDDGECWVCKSNFDFSCSRHLWQAQLQKDQQHQPYQYPHHVKDKHNCPSGKVPNNFFKHNSITNQAFSVFLQNYHIGWPNNCNPTSPCQLKKTNKKPSLTNSICNEEDIFTTLQNRATLSVRLAPRSVFNGVENNRINPYRMPFLKQICLTFGHTHNPLLTYET